VRVKKIRWNFLAATGLLLLLTVSLASAQPSDGNVSATVTEVEGLVEAFRAGETEWSEAKEGQTYKDRDALSTDLGSSAVLVFHDQHQLKVKENTELTIRRLYQDAQTGEQVTEVDLSIGEVLSRVRSLPTEGSIYTIHTPTATSSVRGTVFNVQVFRQDGQLVTKVQVLEGEIEVLDQTGEILRVLDNQQAEIDEAGVPAQTERLGRGERRQMQNESRALGAVETGDTGQSMDLMDTGLSDDTLIEEIEQLENQVEDIIDEMDQDINEPVRDDMDDDDDPGLFQ